MHNTQYVLSRFSDYDFIYMQIKKGWEISHQKLVTMTIEVSMRPFPSSSVGFSRKRIHMVPLFLPLYKISSRSFFVYCKIKQVVVLSNLSLKYYQYYQTRPLNITSLLNPPPPEWYILILYTILLVIWDSPFVTKCVCIYLPHTLSNVLNGFQCVDYH